MHPPSPEERAEHASYIASPSYTRMRDRVLEKTTVDLHNSDHTAEKVALMLAKADGIRAAFARFEELGVPPMAGTPSNPIRPRTLERETPKS